MRIAPAAAELAEALAALHAQAFTAPWSAQAFADLLRGAGVFALIGEDQGQAAGLILIRSIAGEAEVLTLAVAPAHRRRGLAQALLTAGLDLAASAGAASAFLEVAQDNPAATALYEQAGFTPAGRRRGYYARPDGAGVDALVLTKRLAASGA